MKDSLGISLGHTAAWKLILLWLVVCCSSCRDSLTTNREPVAPPSIAVTGTEKNLVPSPSGSALKNDDVSLVSIPNDLSLPDKESARIWDREHHANLLNEHGFKPLGRAIRELDRSALLALLADSVEAQVLDLDALTDFRAEGISAERWTAGDSLRTLPDSNAFADWLFQTTSFITTAKGTQVGVLKISPIDTEDGSWNVVGVLRVWGQHEDEPAELRVWVQLTVAKPTKENLDAGHWLQAIKATQVARSQASHPLFVDRTANSGINVEILYDNWDVKDDVRNVTGGIYATDFDHDGRIDLLVTDVGSAPERLYRGTPEGKFIDVSRILGTPFAGRKSGIIAAFVDLDGDGYDDLIYGDGVIRQNVKGTRFKDVTALSNFGGLCQVLNPMMGPSIEAILPADFDRDGKMDLFVCRLGLRPKSWLVSTSQNSPLCQLLRNLGDWRFEDVTSSLDMGGGGRSVFSSVWSDFNSDGWPDLYMINEFGEGVMYVNHEGRQFEQIDIDPATLSFGGMGVGVGDIDNDGNIDVYSAEMYSKAGSRVIGNMRPDAYEPWVMDRLRSLVDGSEMYRNLGNMKFEGVGRKLQVHDVGWAWGPAVADFNNDGWLDIYATAGYISRDRNKPDG